MKNYLSILLLLCIVLSACSKKAINIGMIGGADGPTAIYVTSDINWQSIAVGAVVAVVTVLVVTYFKKRK